MENFLEWLFQYAPHAHWFIFAAIIMAGLNIPISIDLMAIVGAFLAATVVPEHTPYLFLAVFLGCLLSAWTSYWFGRLLGPKFLKFQWFSKILPQERLLKIKSFYEKHGFLTLILGRFIPFGVRNCIFMSTGISRASFGKFVVRDLFAAFLWSSVCFYLFYTLGQNYQALYQNVKTFNIAIFSAFGVTVIGFIWYKKRKRKKAPIIEKNLPSERTANKN